MDLLLYAAGIMAFAPTLLLMYAVLRKYTYPAVEQPFFSDPVFFKLFVVGLIAGTFLFLAYTYLAGYWANMIYMVLFAAIQCLAMVVVMNLKRFHGKSDSVFYGYGLGLGMGCTMAFGTIFYIETIYLGMTLAGTEEGEIGAAGLIWLFLIALSYVLMLSAIGTTVGEGIARRKPMEFAMQAVFVNAVFSLILVAAYSSTDNEIMFYACLVLALIVAAVYFYYIMYVKLSRVVRDVLRMEGKPRKDVPK
ncbi:MAG: hypothetical protein LBB30_04980 [Candidatus Methanoplasma sp.]|jgi:hypothetical protein|nr:hypothetical protein [Candidatus Methanoplasma sp.]